MQEYVLRHFIISLTVLRNHGERDGVPCVFDKLNNVVVGEFHNGLTVHSRYAVAHIQQPTAVSWTALDYSTDLMRNHCNTHLGKSLSRIRMACVLFIIIIMNYHRKCNNSEFVQNCWMEQNGTERMGL